MTIIYYSMYGHVLTMAESVKRGVESTGTTCDVNRVEETLSNDILGKMGASPKADHPIITVDKMTEYDGFLFGISGRFSSVPAQMKVRSNEISHSSDF
jgi:NAD(P)H dehydrogenase (quinone)